MVAEKQHFFVVIEGLDGSGKTAITQRLAQALRACCGDDVLLTYEPYDPLCAGLFIRQVLTKQITAMPRALALAFAANRADHNERQITPFLKAGEGRIVVCDRYYLSSLVYQTPAFSHDEIMLINSEARQPDLTLFLDASVATCYQRMNQRPADRQLFESNLEDLRRKYDAAISYLRERGENIVVLNADGTLAEVLNSVIAALNTHSPAWLTVEPVAADAAWPEERFTLRGDARQLMKTRVEAIINTVREQLKDDPPPTRQNFREMLRRYKTIIAAQVNALSFDDLALLFLGYLDLLGYRVGEPLPGLDFGAYAMIYTMPMDLKQRGAALLLGSASPYDALAQLADYDPPDSGGRFDFLFVLDPAQPGEGELYERDTLHHTANGRSLIPAVRSITRANITRFVLADFVGRISISGDEQTRYWPGPGYDDL